MYQIIQLIEAACSQVATISSPYLDEVNSFPSVSVLRPTITSSKRRATITRDHIGKRATIDKLEVTVRGYVHSSLDSSMTDCDVLARQLEIAIQSINSHLIFSSYVISLSTDEGLYSPYGICELVCIVEWLNE